MIDNKMPKFEIDDLDFIFIRAQETNGHWDSFSINEITDEQFVAWAKSKGLRDIKDSSECEGQPWTKEQKVDLLNYLQDHGVIIYMIRREKRKAFNKMTSSEKDLKGGK